MRFKRIASMVESAARLVNKYTSYSRPSQTIYRIVDVKESLSGQYKLAIQLIGKSTVIEFAPQEIVANDRMLEGFAKKDIRTITYFACEQKQKPIYKIVVQEFCVALNKILFKLKKHDTGEVVAKTADQIFADKDIIAHLSQEDICSICYAAGYEQSSQEKDSAK